MNPGCGFLGRRSGSISTVGAVAAGRSSFLGLFQLGGFLLSHALDALIVKLLVLVLDLFLPLRGIASASGTVKE
jgi:hypothetical protein